MNQLYIFDLDDTLVIPDYEIDKQNLYMTIDHHVPIPEMMALFNDVKSKHPVQILTNRHPDLKHIIESRYGCPAICRDYCLSVPEMEVVEQDVSAKEQFLHEMTVRKTKYINNIAGQYDEIIFYDDMMHRYDVSKFAPNVSMKMPVHLTV